MNIIVLEFATLEIVPSVQQMLGGTGGCCQRGFNETSSVVSDLPVWTLQASHPFFKMSAV